jgi:uncharacterized spore protein YtfJ
MSAVERIAAVVEELRESASVETVYGDPIERGDRTAVPVASVGYGFGGGWGTGESDPEAVERNGSDAEEPVAQIVGSGGGIGGGASATPVGVLEITEEGTEFVRFEESRRAGVALFVGLVVGVLLGRR